MSAPGKTAALAVALPRPARGAAAEVLQDWPCPGCVTVVPGAADAGPMPLLVALHGDGGGVRPLVRAWQAAASAAGVILLAPRCPRELGCTTGSFWQWYDTQGHDPAWLGAQIDAAAARFPVDPRRVYATGYSGGATYLGWYAPRHADRFAAVAHVAGGAAYRPDCPACKVPVLFVLGASDPMIGPYTRPLRDWYEACGGHEILWETLPGVTHESILQTARAGKAREILALAPGEAGGVPGGAGGRDGHGPWSDAGAERWRTGDAGGSRIEAPVVEEGRRPPHVARPDPPKVAPPVTGCACGVGAGGQPGLRGRGGRGRGDRCVEATAREEAICRLRSW